MFSKLYKIRVLLFVLSISTCCFSQVKEEPIKAKKIEAGFEGMIALSFNEKAIGINVGGPSLKYKCNANCKIGAGAFPSLIILDNKAYPRLGISPIIEYKSWLFIAPYYGYDAKDKMIWTYGIGYKF